VIAAAGISHFGVFDSEKCSVIVTPLLPETGGLFEFCFGPQGIETGVDLAGVRLVTRDFRLDITRYGYYAGLALLIDQTQSFFRGLHCNAANLCTAECFL
jgi:hypothetical protein